MKMLICAILNFATAFSAASADTTISAKLVALKPDNAVIVDKATGAISNQEVYTTVPTVLNEIFIYEISSGKEIGKLNPDGSNQLSVSDVSNILVWFLIATDEESTNYRLTLSQNGVTMKDSFRPMLHEAGVYRSAGTVKNFAK